MMKIANCLGKMFLVLMLWSLEAWAPDPVSPSENSYRVHPVPPAEAPLFHSKPQKEPDFEQTSERPKVARPKVETLTDGFVLMPQETTPRFPYGLDLRACLVQSAKSQLGVE